MSDHIEMEVDIVGIKHRWASPLREEIGQVLPLEVKVVRDFYNRFDENAIAVYAPAGSLHIEDPKKGLRTDGLLGYLSAKVAEVLAPKLDDNIVVIISGVFQHMHDGDNLTGSISLVLEKIG